MTNWGRRRSARISAITRQQVSKHVGATPHSTGRIEVGKSSSNGKQPPLPKKRGRKKKRLKTVEEVVNSVAAEVEHAGKDSKYEDLLTGTDEQLVLPPMQWMPEKRILELIIDILQRRDTYEIFAEPVDSEQVEGYYEIIKEPMDFGTMRAKLQKGMYTTLEQFQARALNELAKKVFHALKCDPGNFEFEFLTVRRGPGRRPRVEGRGSGFSSHASSNTDARLNSATLDVLSNGGPYSVGGFSRVRNNDESILGAPSSNSHAGRSALGAFYGFRDGKKHHFAEAERRWKYRPWPFFLNENESTASTIYNRSKPLMPVSQESFGYKDSLKKFVQDLGPTAKRVASQKLEKCNAVAPEDQIQSLNCQVQAPFSQTPAASGQWRPTPLDGMVSSLASRQKFLSNFSSHNTVSTDANNRMNTLSAFGGKKASISDGRDICYDRDKANINCSMISSDYSRDNMKFDSNNLRRENAHSSDKTNFYSTSGEMDLMNYRMGISGAFGGDMAHISDKMDNIHAILEKGMCRAEGKMNLHGERACNSDRLEMLGAFRREMSLVNDRLNVPATVQGELASISNVVNIPHVGDRNDIYGTLGGKMAPRDGRMCSSGEMVSCGNLNFAGAVGGKIYPDNKMDFHGAFRGEIAHNSETMRASGLSEEMGWSRNEINFCDASSAVMARQNDDREIQLASYFPFATVGDLKNFSATGVANTGSGSSIMMVDSSNFGNMVQSTELASNYSESGMFEFLSANNGFPASSSWPVNASYLNQIAGSLHYMGEDKKAMAAWNPCHETNTWGHAFQALEWSRPTASGPQAILNMSSLQSRLNEMNSSSGRDKLKQQPESQLCSTSGGPWFDAMSYYEKGPAISHQAGPSTEDFLEMQPPNLALQL